LSTVRSTIDSSCGHQAQMATKHMVFLHIPRTAGQSVHAFLETLFGADQVSPARVNYHLAAMTVSDIRRHRVFSGHFDWSLLDCLPDPKFTFTLLRDPLGRILSFYFFLRAQASDLPQAELLLPRNQGIRAALQMSPDQFFVSPDNPIREFLDDHFDNFYGYFFGGRTYDARRRLLGLASVGSPLDDKRLISMALANLSLLSGVYDTSRLEDLECALRGLSIAVPCQSRLSDFRVNQGDSANLEERSEMLRQLGATSATFDRLQSMVRIDQVIWAEARSGLGPR
jgi:hypothetical protein